MYAPTDPKDAPSDKATCAVVGTVSPERMYLEPHGNFTTAYGNGLETSKAQFQIIPSDIHTEFGEDLKLGIRHLERLQNKVITEGPDPEHFITWDGRTKALKFSWPLFTKRVCVLLSRIWCC